MLVKSRERVTFPTWRERLSESFLPLDIESLGSGSHLDAHISGASNGTVRAGIVDVEGEPHRVRRTGAQRSQSDGDLLISVQLSGVCLVRQAGREAQLEAGDIALYESSHSYDLVFPSGSHQQAVLQVPFEGFAAPGLLDLTAVKLPGRGVGHAIGALFTSLPAAIQDAPAVESERLAHAGLDLLAVALSADRRVSHSADRLYRIKAFISRNADDSELTPGTVAQGMHLSSAHLHRIFQQSDTTVAEYVRNVRLHRAASDLRDAKMRHWTVTEIALMRGFQSPAHFSRSFTAKYGVPPSQWRRSSDDDLSDQE